ncbi:MAG: isoprenylcysteine carboxylmethyltransferase family protein [Pyrinomonadaceae bacterium]
MSGNRKKTLQKIRVPLGFLFAAVFLIFARPTPFWVLVGYAVGLLGLAIRAWSAGHIRKNRELAVSGPYAFTRNPLYLGSFVMGIGVTMGSAKWWLVLLFAILFMGIYLPVMSVEQDELTELFGTEFEEYAASVPLFFPWFSHYKKTASSFDPSLYMKYREYRAAIGLTAICAALFLKGYFFA